MAGDEEPLATTFVDGSTQTVVVLSGPNMTGRCLVRRHGFLAARTMSIQLDSLVPINDAGREILNRQPA